MTSIGSGVVGFKINLQSKTADISEIRNARKWQSSKEEKKPRLQTFVLKLLMFEGGEDLTHFKLRAFNYCITKYVQKYLFKSNLLLYKIKVFSGPLVRAVKLSNLILAKYSCCPAVWKLFSLGGGKFWKLHDKIFRLQKSRPRSCFAVANCSS